jgi:DNA end-binding protein Ku
MPRPIWKGHISFGLVTIPINLHTAEQPSELSLHMVDSRDLSRIHYNRVNEDGKEVPWDKIVRGYEYKKGKYVILTDADLKRAAPEITRSVDIQAFVPLNDISPVYFDKPYYVEPAKGGEKGYLLLRRALEDAELVGITRVVIRTRQHTAALLPSGDMLILNILRYDEELKSPDKLNIPASLPRGQMISPQETKIARLLVEQMAGKWEPEAYRDEYRKSLLAWIQRRVKAGQITSGPAEDEPETDVEAPAPINFLELLKQSVGQSGSIASRRKHSRSHTRKTQRRKAG